MSKKRISIFILCVLVSLFCGWLSGYNFDSRNFGVAYWVFSTIILSWLLATYPGIED